LWIDDEDQVEIAVAGVAHERGQQRRRAQIRSRLEDALGETGDRYTDVCRPSLAARTHGERGVERVVPRVPQLRARLGCRRPAAIGPAVPGRELLHERGVFGDARVARAVELEEQRRLNGIVQI